MSPAKTGRRSPWVNWRSTRARQEFTGLPAGTPAVLIQADRRRRWLVSVAGHTLLQQADETWLEGGRRRFRTSLEPGAGERGLPADFPVGDSFAGREPEAGIHPTPRLSVNTAETLPIHLAVEHFSLRVILVGGFATNTTFPWARTDWSSPVVETIVSRPGPSPVWAQFARPAGFPRPTFNRVAVSRDWPRTSWFPIWATKGKAVRAAGVRFSQRVRWPFGTRRP